MFERPFKPGIRISYPALLILTFTAIAGLLIMISLRKEQTHPVNPEMIAAATRVLSAQSALSARFDSLSNESDRQLDPMRSALIGVEFTPLTTTLGNLEAKQISTSPDFAALFIRWFYELDLKENERVTIHASASFPALILSALCAAEEWGLNIQLITSAGASSFGANRPLWTWWDMESFLYSQGLIHTRTSLATPGGPDDNGASFWPGGLEACQASARRNGLDLLIPDDYAHAVRVKLSMITAGELPALFINIGGNEIAVGRPPCSLDLNPGLIKITLPEEACEGLIHKLSRMNIPVLHLLHIKELAAYHGLGADIRSFQGVGMNPVYKYIQSNRTGAVLAFLLIIASWITFFIIQRHRSTKDSSILTQ